MTDSHEVYYLPCSCQHFFECYSPFHKVAFAVTIVKAKYPLPLGDSVVFQIFPSLHLSPLRFDKKDGGWDAA